MILPISPSVIGFPVIGLDNAIVLRMEAQTSNLARFPWSELKSAWAPANEAIKGKSTRMPVKLVRATQQKWEA